MPLSIDLDNPQPCYFGHERIGGRVILQTTTPIDVETVRITFSGHTKAKIKKAKGSGAPVANYRSKCLLFEKVAPLAYMNGGTLAPGTYEWQFEFHFPSHVEYPSPAKWPEKIPFRNDANHPLPPTFAIETSDSARKLECRIDYQLEAKVSKPQRGLFASKSSHMVEVLKLNFTPAHTVSDAADQDPNSTVYRQYLEQLFSIRSKLLLLENKGRSLGVQEKLKGWFFSSQLPRFSYKASFSFPTRIIQSTPLACYLEITPYLEDSSVVVAPEIKLQSLSITIISQTAARATPSIVGNMSAEIDERINIVSRTSLGTPVSGTIDLGQVFGPLVLRPTEVSFGTFNISRTYRLCASFVFECVGKTHELSASNVPIEILSNAKEPGRIPIPNIAELPLEHSSDEEEEEREEEVKVEEREEDPPAYTPTSSLPSPLTEKSR
ncbi:uncharacterized protein BJX67DRAFT_344869 [Aspergillus lucknowensis]|uniref:Arrestin-like N-terminal domain-containing protein n=1 Tax=Aspergillus lucknowensis TaxID=176173 RepID=A0ABR4M2S9_9EURO